MNNAEKLDNPAWYSLSETHQAFAIEYKNIKFYHPGYCTFGGFKTSENSTDAISEYSLLTDNFFVIGKKPLLPESVTLKNELICLQMITSGKIDFALKENIVKLGKDNINELSALVNLVQPGYFKEKTSLLGNYYGVFRNDQLVAVTGERMKMNDYVEVSAVVTHPNHTGKGYAKQLVAHTVNSLYDQGRLPYLHVSEINTPAIRLYERLGFRVRRKISFWNITR